MAATNGAGGAGLLNGGANNNGFRFNAGSGWNNGPSCKLKMWFLSESSCVCFYFVNKG